MNTSNGFCYSSFGERLTIEVRKADGTTKKDTITREWYEDLRILGMISDSVLTTVIVNMVRSMFNEQEVCA